MDEMNTSMLLNMNEQQRHSNSNLVAVAVVAVRCSLQIQIHFYTRTFLFITLKLYGMSALVPFEKEVCRAVLAHVRPANNSNLNAQAIKLYKTMFDVIVGISRAVNLKGLTDLGHLGIFFLTLIY